MMTKKLKTRLDPRTIPAKGAQTCLLVRKVEMSIRTIWSGNVNFAVMRHSGSVEGIRIIANHAIEMQVGSPEIRTCGRSAQVRKSAPAGGITQSPGRPMQLGA
jgi:hypothetical protein